MGTVRGQVVSGNHISGCSALGSVSLKLGMEWRQFVHIVRRFQRSGPLRLKPLAAQTK
jgi:hypothetical protein